MSGSTHLDNQESSSTGASDQRKYKGVRQRKWGKWVSEIRVPGTQERLWLGSYSTPEAAAVAHDVASYCLRVQQQSSSMDSRLNFPLMLPASLRADMSPKSIQKAASDAGMAIDAHMILNRSRSPDSESRGNEGGSSGHGSSETDVNREHTMGNCGNWEGTQPKDGGETLSISVEDYL
ncbi:hypothetical protein P3X46_028149 [Hevea brasiliensis]|uniref:AP2/ERF domain-containing protein n=1 Tax=Hevea brasiliensis TaxID=3981 RepID=A0ABQ9KR31_HEVBR|nr:ethylene-responsive transcription factor ERF020 [Hevea brasiliensis]KAJ9145815.1 hypothetical protein P3X46_028149 [Hevea brasiliensis]